MKTYLKKITALTMIVSFSFVQFAFAQSDTSSTDASSATAPSQTSDASTAPDTTASAPATTDNSSTPIVAPTDSSSPTTTASAPPSTTSGSSSSTVDPQDAGSVSVQDTSGDGQSTVTGDMLESTADPQSATSSDTEIIVVDATSSSATSTADDGQPLPIGGDTGTSTVGTINSSTSSADVVAQNIDPNASTAPDTSSNSINSTDLLPTTDASTTDQSTQQTLPQPQAVSIPIADLAPQPQYSFAITGTSIPATKMVQNSDGTVTQTTVSSETLSPAIDNTSGTVTVSGACSAAYFVVLLFKNATDYADDPSSYLVNKAYPCTQGTFTYSIAQLPYALPNGNYYLMVAQEGTTGTWTPLTTLSEITINRTQ